MTPQTFDKRHLALRQLETALDLLEHSDDRFSVITLAGAADEILGELVRAKGGIAAVTTFAEAESAIHLHLYNETLPPKYFVDRANRARNTLKHLRGHEGPTVTFDPAEEAADMLNRAIDNYWLLTLSLTEPMERFSKRQRVIGDGSVSL